MNNKTVRSIVKYQNRKFYDRTASRYVSLGELGKIAIEEDIEVVDDQSGSDLTIETLSRVLYEYLRSSEIGEVVQRHPNVKSDLVWLISKVMKK
jgi:polyhydroxyalkanoate synthesis regulator protein